MPSVEERLDQFGQYPLDVVLDNLALDISALRGKKVLDLGCGATANLVRHLRKQGVDAEGIDSGLDKMVLKSGPKGPIAHLMKGDALSIPRPDGHYTTVLSHYAAFVPGTVRYASKFATEQTKKVPQEECTTSAQELLAQPHLLEEALRVLDGSGKLIIVPLPDYLLKTTRQLLKREGIKREIQRVQSDMVTDIVEEQDKTGYGALYRLVLTKPNSQR